MPALNISLPDGYSPYRVVNNQVSSLLCENKYSPVFPNAFYDVNASESLSAGSPVIRLVATDEDEGTNGILRYSITGVSGNNNGDLFSIDALTGTVLLNKSLDFDDSALPKRYTLTIMVADGSLREPRIAYTSLTINVLDSNDNAPVFSQSLYSASLLENATVGTFILAVKALDKDAMVNGLVVYSLVSMNDGEDVSGIISFNQSNSNRLKSDA
jgi:hypothetical protein